MASPLCSRDSPSASTTWSAPAAASAAAKPASEPHKAGSIPDPARYLRLSSKSVWRHGRVRASVDVENVSGPTGDEVVQLYINDPVASLSQPVRRLRGFERVTLKAGEKRTVTFTLDQSDFGFHDNSGKLVVEPGRIDVHAGNSSKADLTQSFQVTG